MYKKTSVIMAVAVAAVLAGSVLAFALPNKAFADAVVVRGGAGGVGGAGGAGGTGGNGGLALSAGNVGVGSGSVSGTSHSVAIANGGDANGGHGGNANGGSARIGCHDNCGNN